MQYNCCVVCLQAPADAANRRTLLSLLYATDDRVEFVREALEFKKRCEPIDDDVWGEICEMGRSLAPESKLFKANDKEASHKAYQEDQRVRVERRSNDRRQNRSTWLGAERRRHLSQRRWHARRDADRDSSRPRRQPQI